MSRIRQFILIAALLGILSLLPQRLVFADTPTHQFNVDMSFSFTFPGDYTGCGFPVTISQTGVGNVTTYYDQSGNVTRIHTTSPPSGLVAFVSANGITYTSISSGNIWTFYVDGNPTLVTVNGLEEHIVIPGTGVVGQATGTFSFNPVTGPTEVHGQFTMSSAGNWSPAVCALFTP
jgi:hypothetical protein